MKRILCIVLCFILITGGVLMTSCNENDNDHSESTFIEESCEDSSEVTGEKHPDNIALNCHVFYDCGLKVKGDGNITLLTDGDTESFATLTASLDKGEGCSYTAIDWYGNKHIMNIENKTAAITVDFGFMAEINGFEIVFNEYSGEPCDIFYSTDGYNLSYYCGKKGEYENGILSSPLSVNAKSVMFVFPIDSKTTIKISEIRVFGKKSHEKLLLSENAAYEWNGEDIKRYADDGKKLTDGVVCALSGEEAVAGKRAEETDELTGKKGNIITLDLGSVKNVSEVFFGVYSPKNGKTSYPKRATVRYSADGENWYDLGQSFLRTAVSEKENSSYKFLITRNHTVEARYVRVYAYNNESSMFLCDEIYVYGSETPVSEPQYDFINRKNQVSNANVASFVKASLNGKVEPSLTDLSYKTYSVCNKGTNTVTIPLSKAYDDICGFAMTYDSSEVGNVSIKCDGKAVENLVSYSSVIGKNTTVYYYFDSTKAEEVSVSVDTEAALKLKECHVFASAAHLPTVKGGFFQLPTNGSAGDTASENSDYSWYLQLKGMKDLGMDTVIVQYSAHYLAKSTLINGKNIVSAGYKYNATYGSSDVYSAILGAADKLNMQVFVGTINDADFTSPIANTEQYNNIVKDAVLLIKDINEMYSHHKSFAGYYLSDEECDQWLNMRGGVEAARIIYKGQSDYIRNINSKAKIMIAPAIWRSGTPEKGGDSLYSLIAADDKNGRPIVDIVAAQDCLGRLDTLEVDDNTYHSYEEYCSEWARAVRRAGAEFWHDTEVFEQVSTTKRYNDIVKSLGIQAKLSGTIVVFDIPHYFTLFPSADFNDIYAYYKTLIMREYAKYYSGFYSLDVKSENATQPIVSTDDGKTVVDTGNDGEVKEQSKTYNEGVMTNQTPKIAETDKLNWQKFSLPNSSFCPEYAYSFDSEAVYVCVRANDETNSFGKGQWWEGKDDLIQVWMVSSGATASSALNDSNGVRLYLHKTGNGWSFGGESGGKADISGISFTFDEKNVIIKMPWDALGVKPQAKGNGKAIGVFVQYIDGNDGSWAASEGTKSQSLSEKALYSY